MTNISKLNNKPLKKFGQNYLVDKNIVLKFLKFLEPNNEDKIIEIGPGRGAITEELQKYNAEIIAVEIDKRVFDQLEKNYPQIKMINEDFLKFDIKGLINSVQQCRIVGNIPFNLTSTIIFKLIEERKYVSDALFIVQSDVAKRIVAKPNNKEYGILSVILNYFCEVSICFEISPNAFYPKPKVKSAAIYLNFRNNHENKIDADHFITVVKACFGNRRKTLKNSLNNSIFKNCNFSEINLDFSKRAENLSVQDYEYLAMSLLDENCYGR